MLGWDGQLEDDARLVTTVARTAASYGAHVRTRARVVSATGTSVQLRDELTGASHTVTARTVINATGVWAGDLVDEVRLRPSRGTHLVLREETLPGLRVVVYAPIPGTFNRFVLVLPQPDGTIYVGLTDEPADGPVPDVPQPTEPEIGFLLDVVSAAFEHPVHRSDVVGAFAGLRPLLDVPGEGETADISRRHAVLTSRTGVVTIVGGKLTTYRRMAEDAIDAALAHAGIDAAPCRTRALPLLGAADRLTLAGLELPAAPGPPLRHRCRTGARHRAQRHRAQPTTSCSCPSPSTSRSPWPSWCSASPTKAPWTSTTCWTAAPGSAWSRPTGRSPYPPPSGPWRWPGPACNSVFGLHSVLEHPSRSPNTELQVCRRAQTRRAKTTTFDW